MLTTSRDRGRTWSLKRPLTEPLRRADRTDPSWDCPRISRLSDGRLVAVTNRETGAGIEGYEGEFANSLLFSEDDGETWDGPHPMPVDGAMPDQVIELRRGEHRGRWVVTVDFEREEDGVPVWRQECWHSDDRGVTWSGPHPVACERGLMLCEGSIVEMPGGELVCFMRENSHLGLDAYKCISRDGGTTWEGPAKFPLPGCHRPVAGMLQSGRVMVTYRFCQGGKDWLGWWTQNLFAAVTDVESCLAADRQQAHTRIMPLDYDRSPVSDIGYTGWVQFPDGEIYVVTYIVDDAPKAHIRGYAFREEAFLF
jgi:sialidase-1